MENFSLLNKVNAVYVGPEQNTSKLLSTWIIDTLEGKGCYVARKSSGKLELTSVVFSVGSVIQDSRSGGTMLLEWKVRQDT